MTAAASEGSAYIGRDANSVVVTAVVDDGRMKTARLIKTWMRQGLAIQLVPVEWVRENLGKSTPYPAAQPPAEAKP